MVFIHNARAGVMNGNGRLQGLFVPPKSLSPSPVQDQERSLARDTSARHCGFAFLYGVPVIVAFVLLNVLFFAQNQSMPWSFRRQISRSDAAYASRCRATTSVSDAPRSIASSVGS